MKILYAIQGTGNGHIARAREIIPLLREEHEVHILVSGTQADIDIPYIVKYRFDGLSFIFGKKGGVDIFETYKKANLRQLYKEIRSLDLSPYDLVLNDFEPVSAWACKLQKKLCISVSHQAAVLNKNVPKPKKSDPVGKAVLKRYAPSDKQYGFHFKAYDKNIFTPVIRKEIRELKPENKGHYTVYLPAYDDDRIMNVLEQCSEIKWEVFSKHNKRTIEKKNITVNPINNGAFIRSMAFSAGVLCGAGFETPAEALFLGKKLMVIPMKSQYEQQCNAAALKEMGVPVIKSLKTKHVDKINEWLSSTTKVAVDYPDQTAAILQTIIAEAQQLPLTIPEPEAGKIDSLNKFREKHLKTIIKHIEAG